MPVSGEFTEVEKRPFDSRLVAFLAGLFKENPDDKYGLSTMCVGRGQGYSMIWENLL